jgi:hypothetical protein
MTAQRTTIRRPLRAAGTAIGGCAPAAAGSRSRDADDRERERTVDLHLIQALHQTRRLADAHGEEPGWDTLRARLDAVLAAVTDDARDPTTESIGVQRIDRAAIPEDTTRVVAALTALHDHPVPEQLERATAAVEDLGDAVGA